VRAALVGRLFLSSLHTNDATASVPRLLDMGIEPFLLASTLVLVMGQRLVRRICMSCRQSRPLDEGALAALRARPDFADALRVLRADGVIGSGDDALASLTAFAGRGCEQCKGTGFRGRVAIFELCEIDDHSRRMIMESRDGVAVREAAIARGMKTMFQDSLAKTLLGETTLEEVFRVAV
jgi:type II secretory ATPase GspE/PulE/Tfp pilus assembly ATPase PilB-like protein